MIKERGGEILACLFPAGSPGVPGKGIREPVVVARGEKEKIFGRGYGKNTGWGLFLSREILAITGMSIRENGVPGEGARFLLTVPGGSWKYVTRPAAGKEH